MALPKNTYGTTECENLINKIQQLKYPEYFQADQICIEVKDLASKYLPDYFIDNNKLNKLNFKKQINFSTWENKKCQMLSPESHVPLVFKAIVAKIKK